MKTPITIDENGDISIFATVEEAEHYMEPIDVEHGEYKVFDADGRQLLVEIYTEKSALLGGLLKNRLQKVRIRDAT